MLTYSRDGAGGVDGTGKPLAATDGSHEIGLGEDRGEKNPFDRWLMQKLHGVFDAISQEPLPADLLNLVRQLETKEKASTAQMQLDFSARSVNSRMPEGY